MCHHGVVQPRADTPAAAVSVSALSKRFGAIQALDRVDVEIDAAATGLLGANGAGKSTLMRAILGLERPDSGSIRVLGIDAASRAGDVRRRIGYMPEHDCLPRSMSARDAVMHFAELRGLTRRAAAVRASEVLFQVGLEEERSRPIETFSLGMTQRTKLAQALVHSPELVLLDEPTAGLDPDGRLDMLALVRRISRDLGIRVLMSSHLLDDVRRTCDEIVVLSAGRVSGRETIAARDTDDNDGVRVRVTGDAEAFVSALRADGHAVERSDGDPGLVALERGGPAVLDIVRDTAADLGLGIVEVSSRGRTLEDAVVEAMS